MTAAGIEVKNARAVQAGFDELARTAADIADPAREVLAIGLRAARGEAPVKTGELRGSIDVVDVGPSGGELAARAPHAAYQEFGTRYIKGKRFMRAGHDAAQSAAADVFTKDLERKVAQATQKA